MAAVAAAAAAVIDSARFDTLTCRTSACRVEKFTRGSAGRCPCCDAVGQEPWEAADLG